MMETHSLASRLVRPAGFLAAATIASWLLISGARTDHHRLHAEAPEVIQRKGYKPYLRARQANSVAPSASASATGGSTSGSSGSSNSSATTGGNGSVITLSDGTTFVYTNSFNGTFASAPGDFSARAQARSPALDEEWNWNDDKTFGVNLGGWLVTEPFITPNVYMPYQNATPRAIDEYTLSQALGDDLADYMTNHYETFITERDFADIAAAGMNWIRLPVPFWIVETVEEEPYLEGVAWNYMIQAFEWARKYGLRVELDLHTVPGSQNGLNHSGRLGGINFLNGVMGIVNAQRTLNVIRILTETINRPEYRHVILFNIVNEAYVSTIGPQAIREFYLEAYQIMRNITGYGADKGPFMIIHDGFIGLDTWNGFLTGADRLGLESHYYFAFSPDNFGSSLRQMVTRPCQWWAGSFNTSTRDFGLTIGGEWSLAVNDCGLWLNSVTEGAYFDGTHSGSSQYYGSCEQYTDVSQFSDDFKQQLQDFTLANMDTFQNFMFWTWKTQRNLTSGLPYNPLWCYSCGLEYGYVPTDPAAARGACQRLGDQYGTGGYGTNVPLTSPLAASMTGGTATTSSIAASQLSQYGAWPPPSLTNLPASNLPVYTATGSEPAYPTTLVSPLSVVSTGVPTSGDWYTAIAGCSYLDPYSGLGASVPNSRCTGNGAAAPTRGSAGSSSRVTPAPSGAASRSAGGATSSAAPAGTAAASRASSAAAAAPTGTA